MASLCGTMVLGDEWRGGDEGSDIITHDRQPHFNAQLHSRHQSDHQTSK